MPFNLEPKSVLILIILARLTIFGGDFVDRIESFVLVSLPVLSRHLALRFEVPFVSHDDNIFCRLRRFRQLKSTISKQKGNLVSDKCDFYVHDTAFK